MRPGNLLECAAALMNLRGHCDDGPGGYRKEVCALEAIAMAAGIPRHKYFQTTPESHVAITVFAEFIRRSEPAGPWAATGGNSFEDDLATIYLRNDRPNSRPALQSAMLAASAILNARESAENALYHLEMACV